MQLCFHGTGSGDQQPTRVSSCLSVVSTSGCQFLVDCGEGAVRSLKRDGIDPAEIDALVLSHFHPDHWTGIPGLYLSWRMSERKSPATIYLPPGRTSFVQSVLRGSHLLERPRPFDLLFKEFSETLFCAYGVDIQPFRTSHLKQKVMGQVDAREEYSYGFVFTDDSTRVVFSQDLGGVDDLSGVLEGADLLVCESTHVDPLRVVHSAADAGVPRVIFTHIGPDDEERVKNLVPQMVGNETLDVIVAYDGMTYSLS